MTLTFNLYRGCGDAKCRNCPVKMPACQLRNGLCPGCFQKSK